MQSYLPWPSIAPASYQRQVRQKKKIPSLRVPRTYYQLLCCCAMRLLYYNQNGELCSRQFEDFSLPRYATHSHTWGVQEVSFQDIVDGTASTNPAYHKLRFCGEQARKDGLQYFWIDTCCIDKSNNPEFTEAVNSMYRWYANAAKCYVYLSDVPSNDNKEAFEHDFRRSRWHTRGWTLQELIAPKVVEFFSAEGTFLGDKVSLVQQIHEATNISINALKGSPLSGFSIAQRLSWSAGRETKYVEDKAYCLMGIFDVLLPLIYGEKENAFVRLLGEIGKSSQSKSPCALINHPFI
jgi:hypothetical protein